MKCQRCQSPDGHLYDSGAGFVSLCRACYNALVRQMLAQLPATPPEARAPHEPEA